MSETYRIDLVNTINPEQIYAERQRRKDEADWQNLLGAPQGAQPGQGSLAEVPPELEKPSAIKKGAEAGLEAANAGAKSIFDGLTDALTLGLRPGAPNPVESMKKLVDGLVGFGLSPFVALGAGARQALENEAPEIAKMPVAEGAGAAALRGLIQGTNLPSLSEPERADMFKPFTVGEALDTAIQLGVPAVLPKVPGAAKKLAEANKKLGEEGKIGKGRVGQPPMLPKTKVVDEKGQPQRVYHGTNKEFSEFDKTKSASGNLYGPGLYFTEEPKIASGYANPEPVSGKTLGEFPYTDAGLAQANALGKQLEQHGRNDFTIGYGGAPGSERWRVVETTFKGSPNVRPVYLDIKHPFNIDGPDLPEKVVDRIQAIAGRDINTMNPGSIYEDLSKSGGKSRANEILREAGFDGITHTGGGNTGNAPHRVWIAFDEGQVIEPFERQAPGVGDLAREAFGSERGSVTMPQPGAAGGAERPTVPTAVGAAEGVPSESRVNPRRFEASARVKGVMQNISKLNSERMAESRKVQSHGETVAKAEALGMSLEDAIALDAPRVPLEEVPQVGKAIASHFADASAYLEEADRIFNETRTPESAQNLFDAFAVAAELLTKDEGLGTGLGRGLESRKIISKADRFKFSAEQIKTVSERTQATPHMSADTLSGMLNTQTPAQRKVFLRQVGVGLKNGTLGVYEAYINGLLSNPVSSAANMTSNLLMLPVVIEERAVAGLIRAGKRAAGEAGLKKVFPSWAADAPGVELREATAQILAVQQGILDGLKLTTESWKNESQPFGEGKVETRQHYITAEQFGLSGPVGEAVDYLGTAVRLPTRAMGAEDAFFKGISYRIELAAQAVREAQSQGLRGEDYRRVADDIYRHPERYPEIQARAEQQALVNTFNNQLGEAGQLFGKWIDKLAVARLILPFYKTPANIWKQTYYRIPVLGALSIDFAQALAEGGPRADLAQARLVTGGVIAAGMAGLVAAEKITGAKPKNPTEAAAWEASGKQEYAVNIGGEWIKYNRGTEPLGTAMGVVADYATLVGRLPVDESLVSSSPLLNATMNHPVELALGIKLAMTNLMLNQTYLLQANTLMKALNDEEAASKRLLKNLLQGTLPYSGLLRFATRATDDVKRDTGALTEMQEILNAFREIIPGLSSSLPPMYHHITGEVMHYPEGVVPGNTSLFAYTKDFPTRLMQEIEDNKVSLPKPKRWMGGNAKPNTSGLEFEEENPGTGVYLSGAEYEDFIRHMTHDVKIKGKTLLEYLSAEVESGHYQNLSPGPGGSRADDLQAIYGAFRQKAVDSFLKLDQNQELKQEVEKKVKTRLDLKRKVTSPKSPYYGQPEGSAQRLLDNVGR